MEFEYDGGGIGKGGMVTLYVDSEKITEGRIEYTHPIIFSAGSMVTVGDKHGAPICVELRRSGNRFSGQIQRVQIDRSLDNQDHLVAPEERAHVVVATQ